MEGGAANRIVVLHLSVQNRLQPLAEIWLGRLRLAAEAENHEGNQNKGTVRVSQNGSSHWECSRIEFGIRNSEFGISVRGVRAGIVLTVPKFHHLPLVAICLVAVSAVTQETPPTDRVFMDSVRVDVVNVEVSVTDGDGNPVYGLQREDFELIVKGQPMEISNFYGPRLPDKAASEPGPIALEAVEVPPPPRHIVVFVDHTNLMPARRQEVMESLRGLVEDRLEQGDRIMITAYDARVEVLSNFGDEPEVHAAALETINSTTASTFQTQVEFNRILRCIEVQCNDSDYIRQDIDVYAQDLRHRSRIMLAHLGTVIDSMAGLPGRRSLLLVGDGIAVLPGESLYAIYQNQHVGQDGTMRYQFEARRFSIDRDIDEVTDLANARRVTIYALNNGGVVGSPLSMSSASVSATQLVNTEIDFVRDANYSRTVQAAALSTDRPRKRLTTSGRTSTPPTPSASTPTMSPTTSRGTSKSAWPGTD